MGFRITSVLFIPYFLSQYCVISRAEYVVLNLFRLNVQVDAFERLFTSVLMKSDFITATLAKESRLDSLKSKEIAISVLVEEVQSPNPYWPKALPKNKGVLPKSTIDSKNTKSKV